MRAGAAAVQQTLTQPAQQVLKHAINDARGRGHTQVQPLHVASMLLAHASSPLRQACVVSHPQSPHGLQQCRALEVCFNIALDRLPQSSVNTGQPGLSNALVAALKRAQAHQRRGCPEQQQPPLLAVKVEIEQLIISILDDPSVSKVMREAGFSSTQVKSSLEDAVGLQPVPSSENVNVFDYQLGVAGGSLGMPAMPPDSKTTSVDNFPMFQSGIDGGVSFNPKMHLMSFGRITQPMSEHSPLPTRDEEVQNAIKILLCPTEKNPILVGDSLACVNAVFKQLQNLIKAGEVAEPLRNVSILTPDLSSQSFKSHNRQEMEQKLAELSKIVDECMPQGCILHIGDLQWFVDPVPQNASGSTYCAAQHTAIELGRILDRHKSNRLWFIGVATSSSYLHCQSLHPTLESKWGLQRVPVASAANFGPISRLPMGNSVPSHSGLSSLGLPFWTSSPLARLPYCPYGSSETVGPIASCCPKCMVQLESECKQAYDQQKALPDLEVSQSCSLSPLDKPVKSAEHADGNVGPLPSWLQKEKEMKTEQMKKQFMTQKIQELHCKWQATCRTSQHQFHSSPVSSPANLLHNPLPVDQINANPDPNGVNFGASTNSPMKALVSVVHTPPMSTPPLALPLWARSSAPVAAALSPLASKQTLPPTVSFGVSGMGVPYPVNAERSSSKEGSSVASVLEDPEDKSTETSDRDNFGAPVSIDLALGQSGLSPFAKLRMSSMQETRQQRVALQECRQDLSEGASPLRRLAGQSPLASAALRQVNPPGKSPLSIYSPLRVPQKSSLNAVPTNISSNPQPLTVPNQRAVDGLKHVYKGLMDRVAWQGEAIDSIVRTIMNVRSGSGKLRGVTAKADTWLLLLGPDRVGKRLIANALSELLFGSERKPIRFGLPRQRRDLAHSGWCSEDQEIEGMMRYRGQTQLDRVAEALRNNPLSVVLLEDIDQADAVLRQNLMRAMETGKLAYSSGRQISVSNAIVILTSGVGAKAVAKVNKDIPFCEENLASLGGARMRVILEPSEDNKKVVFHGAPNFTVVESVVTDASCGVEVDSAKWNNGCGAVLSLKRKVKEGPVNETKPDEKRMKVGRAVALDLNLLAEENDEGNDNTADEISSAPDIAKVPACDREYVLRAANETLSSKFCSLVDETVVFEPYNMVGQANRVLARLSQACSSITSEGGACVEIDFDLLKHMVALIWRNPGGEEAFDKWVKEILESSLMSLTVSNDTVLKFVMVEDYALQEELCVGPMLPLQIEVGMVGGNLY